MQDALDTLVRDTAAAAAPFYRERWGSAGCLSEVPSIGREDFVASTLQERRYRDEPSLVKIVRGPEGAFLSEWSFVDIGREPWGLAAKRPMVYLSDPHEAMEKALWCYERGAVPLVGEPDPEVAAAAAAGYRVDALIADPQSLARLGPYLARRREPLEWISIPASSFDAAALMHCAAYARRVRLVLCLPEVGAIAEAPLGIAPRFAPVPGCLIRRDGGSYLVSKTAPLVTPVINYRAALNADISL